MLNSQPEFYYVDGNGENGYLEGTPSLFYNVADGYPDQSTNGGNTQPQNWQVIEETPQRVETPEQNHSFQANSVESFVRSPKQPRTRFETPKQPNNVVYIDLSDEDDEGGSVNSIVNSESHLPPQVANEHVHDVSAYNVNQIHNVSPQRDSLQVQNTPHVPEPSQGQHSRRSSLDMVIDSDSDDEIAVLSKEEAERSGTFKPTSFEMSSRYNQPAPVFHAGGSSQTAESYENQKIREYFERYSVPQIQQHEVNLSTQLVQLGHRRDELLSKVSEYRERVLNLMFDQVLLREELIKSINSALQEAEATIRRSREVRRYQAILNSVKEFRLRQYRAPDAIIPNHQENQGSYGTNVNPYIASRSRAPDDSVHLQHLLNDIYKEEKVEGMAPTPDSMTVQLLDHQRKGLHWLLHREEIGGGSILADDMGLGKTVQALALMMAHPSDDPKCKTTLIVGPVSLLRQWNAEIKAKVKPEFAMSVGFYHGSERKKLSTFRSLSKFDVVLTSYTTLASEYKRHFASFLEVAKTMPRDDLEPDEDSGGQTYDSPFFSADARFYRIVLDEAQYIKNKSSQTSRAACLVKGKYRLCLTGTPMQNSVDELYPIIRFLRVKPYDEESKFKRDIAVPIKSTSDNFDDYDRLMSMKKLRAVLLAIMLRRTKTSKIDGKALLELPEKTVDLVYVTMGKEEEEFYKNLEGGIQKSAERLLNLDKPTLHMYILTLLLRLRQACIHEYLVKVGEMNAEEKSGGLGKWKSKWSLIQNMSDDAKRKVELGVGKGVNIVAKNEVKEATGEPQFTCPLCFDVVDESSIVIFSSCGHMICDSCVLTFFEQHGIKSSENSRREALCNSCNAPVTEDSLVDYAFYEQVVYDGVTMESLQQRYGSEGKITTLNSEKIARIIREHHGFKQSAKMTKTLDIIKDVTSRTFDEKVIVFSHFTTTFDMMAHALKQHNIAFLRYDGTMNIDLKNSVINEFYQGLVRVLLISLRAGNVGLTLTCASHVIIMDPFWNPYVEEQAMDRAHRFGQMKPVKVYKLLVRDSVEDRIMDLQVRKKELIGSALDETALKNSSHLGRSELGYLFGLNSLDRAI